MINAIRNYALIIVVFIHTHIFLISYTQVKVANWLVYFYNNFLSYFHPASLLAAISGFLFFKDYYEHHKSWRVFFKDKYLKRIKSIFIPYFFWITIFFLFNNLLIYFSTRYSDGLFVSAYTPITIRNYLMAFLYPELAVAKHLWYLNNLLFLFIATPFILWLNKHHWLYIIALLLVPIYYYYYFDPSHDQAHHVIKYRFIVFYLIGAFVSLNKKWLHAFMDKAWVYSLASLAVIILLYLPEVTRYNFALLYMVNSVTVTIVIFFISIYIIKKFFHPHDTIYNRSSHFLLYIIHPLLLSLLCKLFFFGNLIEIKHYGILLPIIFLLSFLIIKITKLLYAFAHKYFKTLTLKFL